MRPSRNSGGDYTLSKIARPNEKRALRRALHSMVIGSYYQKAFAVAVAVDLLPDTS